MLCSFSAITWTICKIGYPHVLCHPTSADNQEFTVSLFFSEKALNKINNKAFSQTYLCSMYKCWAKVSVEPQGWGFILNTWNRCPLLSADRSNNPLGSKLRATMGSKCALKWATILVAPACWSSSFASLGSLVYTITWPLSYL